MFIFGDQFGCRYVGTCCGVVRVLWVHGGDGRADTFDDRVERVERIVGCCWHGSASSRPADQNPQKKRSRTRVSATESKRKHFKTNKGKNRAESHLDEEEWSAEDSEDDMNDADLIPREPDLSRMMKMPRFQMTMISYLM